MRVRATTEAPPETGADTVVVGLFEGEGVAHDHGGVLQALVDRGEARPAARKLAVTHADGVRYLLVGLGARSRFDAETARAAATAALARARELGCRTLCWEVPHHVGDAEVAGIVEGTVLAAYAYRAYKSRADDDGPPDELVVSAHHDVGAAVRHAAAGAEAANAARDLQNAPGNELTPSRLAERARQIEGV